MGSIIGGVASAVIGAKAQKKAGKQASQGFNFLRSNPLIQQAQQQGTDATGLIGGLLGLGGDQEASNQAFQQFQDSTGFQFRLGQGINAVEQSSAARGLLNSGATLKGLTQFGQGLASDEFQNFLNNLSNVQGTGINAVNNVASSGQSAGAAKAQTTLGGAQALTSGLASAFQGISEFSRADPATRQPFFAF